MTILLLPLSLLIWLINTSINNRFEKKVSRKTSDTLLYGALCLLTGAALFAVLMRPYFLPSRYTLGLGVLFGVITVLGQLSTLFALSLGPMSLTMLIVFCSMLIPAFSGAVFWKEPIGIFQLIGVVAILVALFLCSYVKVNTKQKRMNGRWRLLCFVAFFSTGMTGVLQKVHQSSPYKNELDAFLVVAFLTGTILTFSAWFLFRKGEKKAKESTHIPTALFAMAGLAGLALGGIYKINMFLSGALPSILFFPINNGGCILLSAIISVVVFKEKLTGGQKLGLLIGVIAIALLGNVMDLIVK